ncbi:hypothetical protein A2U01_0106710, partial [Trifolium medium]|nr:hypothetical protein [Trifolium medium]
MKVVLVVDEVKVIEIVLFVECRAIDSLSARRKKEGVISVRVLVTRRISARKELFASIAKKL